MKLLLLHEGALRRPILEAKIREQSCVASVHLAFDLCQAFDFVEHQLPDIVVTTVDYAQLPEFEIFTALLGAIGTWCIVLSPDGASNFPLRKAKSVLIFVAKEVDFIEDMPRIFNRLPKIYAAGYPSKVANQNQFDSDRVVLIGASTGGVDALLQLLLGYPIHGPPIMIVQHTKGHFSESLARLLNGRTGVTVKTAADREVLQPGHAYLSPGGRTHLCLGASHDLCCHLPPLPTQNGHRPSVDALFHSAIPHATRTTAAILTGMGRDGATGLLALRNAGARTLAQDKDSCVVHGMPAAAVQLGAAEKEVNICSMADAILATCKTKTLGLVKGIF